MSAPTREERLARAEQHAAESEKRQPKGQYPALLARIEALEAAVDRLIVVVEKLAGEKAS